jgi:hypothetical protein
MQTINKTSEPFLVGSFMGNFYLLTPFSPTISFLTAAKYLFQIGNSDSKMQFKFEKKRKISPNRISIIHF